MLELTFYKKIHNKNYEAEIIEVSEKCYERLAKIGFAKKVEYKNVKLLIEDEDYEVNVTELNRENRSILIILIENERHKELQKSFSQIDDNPTIKEIREEFKYIKELTEIYEFLNLDVHQYFSYDWYI